MDELTKQIFVSELFRINPNLSLPKAQEKFKKRFGSSCNVQRLASQRNVAQTRVKAKTNPASSGSELVEITFTESSSGSKAVFMSDKSYFVKISPDLQELALSISRLAKEEVRVIFEDSKALFSLIKVPAPPTSLAEPSQAKKMKGDSQYVGVSRGTHNKQHQWRAQIWHNGTNKFLGNFATEKAAAEAYDKNALRLRGMAAVVNFPEKKSARMAGIKSAEVSAKKAKLAATK